jgi:micrococcal nuclease
MKALSIAFIVLIVLISAGYGQRTITGQVAYVLDGRTLVVKDPVAQYKVRLNLLEVPETDQPLSHIVIDHLRQLASGKAVHITVGRLEGDMVFGVVFVDGQDLALQMLRDGAGWYDRPNINSLNNDENYQQAESLARSEKRGVWGIEGMKPAWEFRIEKIRLERDRDIAEQQKRAEEFKKSRQISRTLPNNEPIPPVLPKEINGVSIYFKGRASSSG